MPTTNLRKLAQELTPSIGPGDFVRVSLTREGKETGPGRRPSRRRLDGRGERRPRARRRSRGDAPGDVGRARPPPAACSSPASTTPESTARGLRSPSRVARALSRRSGQTGAVQTWAIVVAAGGGARFGAAKQFARLGDVSVLDRAVGRRPRVVRRRRGRAARRAAIGPRRPACASRSAARPARPRCGPGSRACPTTPTSWSCTTRRARSRRARCSRA